MSPHERDRPQHIGPEDEAALLALNNAHAAELSWLEPARLTALRERALAAWKIGCADAFLLAFDQSAAYDSPNFLWFRARYPRFVYIDRVVVAPHARGRGLAKFLYAALIETAMALEHTMLACEVNVMPPNPSSDNFHARLGFRPCGMGTVHGGNRSVRYLIRDIENIASD